MGRVLAWCARVGAGRQVRATGWSVIGLSPSMVSVACGTNR